MDLNVIAETPSVQLFKALTHPTRLAILDLLRDGEHCVCHLEAYLGFRQAYISQQLSVLREAGLITDRRDGWNIFYRARDSRVYDLLDATRRITGQAEGAPAPQPKTPCTCPTCTARSASISN
jgi:DNA-binding transcriptional ArsR family regulator